MAVTFVEGRLRGSSGREAGLRFLVDSGAVYSLVPALEELGLVLNPLTRSLHPASMLMA